MKYQQESSNTYDTIRTTEQVVLDTLTNYILKNSFKYILDFGCGTGNYLKELSARTKGPKLYGVDPASSMRSIAKNNNPHIEISDGKHDMIPFKECYFDMIYSIDVIHQIVDISAFFEELYRALAVGGIVFIATESEVQLSNKYWYRFFPEALLVDKARFHSIEVIIECAQRMGFKFIKKLSIEEMCRQSLPEKFIDVAVNKGLSVLHLISDISYRTGLKEAINCYKGRIPLDLIISKTMLFFSKDNIEELQFLHKY